MQKFIKNFAKNFTFNVTRKKFENANDKNSSLGTVCSLMGDDVKAVSYFTKAVALARSTECEDLPSFMVNLGMAKIKLGLKTDANAICEDALMIGKRYQMSEVCLEAQECLKLAGSI